MKTRCSALARLSALAAAAFIFVGAPAAAQQSLPHSISISRGFMEFDASGTGSARVFALRGDKALAGRWLLGEASLAYSPIREQFAGADTKLGIADLQLQFQAPLPFVQPYIGTGLGAVSYLSNAAGRGTATEAVSIAAGVRSDIWRRFGVRADGRIRYWDWNGDGFVNSSGELTAGLSYRF